MTVKNIDQIISWMEGFQPNLESPLAQIEEINEVIDFLTKGTDMSKEVISNKISEERIVKIMRCVQKMTVFAAVTSGEGTSLLIPMASGELEGYTHTVILATIGILIEEEVL